jgi:hypothetical protein
MAIRAHRPDGGGIVADTVIKARHMAGMPHLLQSSVLRAP